MKLMVAAATLYNTVMLACKLSILLLYRRLFPIQSFTKRWWCVAIFTITYSLAIAIASAAGQTPVASKWYLSAYLLHLSFLVPLGSTEQRADCGFVGISTRAMINAVPSVRFTLRTQPST